MNEKVLDCVSGTDVKAKVPDVQFFGNPDTFQLISKASSKEGGWLKSTKAMEIPGCGCVVQVSTQQKNPDGTYAVAEALTFVPYATIQTLYGGVPEGMTQFPAGEYPVIGRTVVSDPMFTSVIGESLVSPCGPNCGCVGVAEGAGSEEKQA
jgi:hypothetical protein